MQNKGGRLATRRQPTLCFSENFKRIGIRIIGFLFVGAIGLFLFAQPLADLLTSSVGQ